MNRTVGARRRRRALLGLSLGALVLFSVLSSWFGATRARIWFALTGGSWSFLEALRFDEDGVLLREAYWDRLGEVSRLSVVRLSSCGVQAQSVERGARSPVGHAAWLWVDGPDGLVGLDPRDLRERARWRDFLAGHDSLASLLEPRVDTVTGSLVGHTPRGQLARVDPRGGEVTPPTERPPGPRTEAGSGLTRYVRTSRGPVRLTGGSDRPVRCSGPPGRCTSHCTGPGSSGTR